MDAEYQSAHGATGPKAPLFDFDGRMMEDVASGHDNAYVGGATFQQAVIEYRVTQLLASLGYPVVPCLGYGRVERSGLSSWCSVFEMQMSPPPASPASMRGTLPAAPISA